VELRERGPGTSLKACSRGYGGALADSEACLSAARTAERRIRGCALGEVNAESYAQVGGRGWGFGEGYAEAGGVLGEAEGFGVAA
jgi:hypothetical protein